MENYRSKSQPNSDACIYDFVFIGLGAANSLILHSLIKNGNTEGKKIAVIESSNKSSNDKTYCFWADNTDSIVSDLDVFISKKYTKLKVNDNNVQHIHQKPYYYIKSIDLYQTTLSLLKSKNIPIVREAVHRVDRYENHYLICAKESNLFGKRVFDSRPPAKPVLKKNEIFLLQSFYGLHIKCVTDSFDDDMFEMMNFNVEQNDFTQFMYVLPFSSNEALVEFTRFGSEIMDKNYAIEILHAFILKNFGEFEVLSDEIGCIPMASHIIPPSDEEGILKTGTSANLIKPSTGYGFKKMYEFAELVSSKLSKNDVSKFNLIALKSKKRFQFYDKLLLIILLVWPSQGKKIFTALYSKQKIQSIFHFLDEKTSLFQELKIFIGLPIIPFLSALIRNSEKIVNGLLVTLFVVIFSFLNSFHESIATYFGYGILFCGLIFIGIPHGAVDHKLSSIKHKSLLNFILKYIAIIAIYFLLWKVSPTIALLIFITYSSFHFGESEFEDLGIKIDSLSNYLEAIALGFSILLFLIYTHHSEALAIIQSFSSIKSILPNFISTEFISILSLLYIIFTTIRLKKVALLKLILILILGLKLPLMLAFGIYFVFQHSLNAWKHLKIGLDKTNIGLYKTAFPFTLGALFLLVFIFIFNSSIETIREHFWANFFIFISSISLPHFILMHLFYRDKNKSFD
jgi:lycopene beta-cyclase